MSYSVKFKKNENNLSPGKVAKFNFWGSTFLKKLSTLIIREPNIQCLSAWLSLDILLNTLSKREKLNFTFTVF